MFVFSLSSFAPIYREVIARRFKVLVPDKVVDRPNIHGICSDFNGLILYFTNIYTEYLKWGCHGSLHF